VRFLPLLALCIGGTILAVFGSWRVLAPVSSMSLLGMTVDATDISLLNELRRVRGQVLPFALRAQNGCGVRSCLLP